MAPLRPSHTRTHARPPAPTVGQGLADIPCHRGLAPSHWGRVSSLGSHWPLGCHPLHESGIAWLPPPPPTEPGLQNFYSLHCVALLSIWSLKQGREMRIMVSMCVQKGHWAAPGMHNSQVRPGAGGLAREGCMCASPLGSQNL